MRQSRSKWQINSQSLAERLAFPPLLQECVSFAPLRPRGESRSWSAHGARMLISALRGALRAFLPLLEKRRHTLPTHSPRRLPSSSLSLCTLSPLPLAYFPPHLTRSPRTTAAPSFSHFPVFVGLSPSFFLHHLVPSSSCYLQHSHTLLFPPKNAHEVIFFFLSHIFVFFPWWTWIEKIHLKVAFLAISFVQNYYESEARA